MAKDHWIYTFWPKRADEGGSHVTSSLSVSRGGVRIRKTVMVDGVAMPTVAYVVESERARPVTVRVVDEMPDGLAAGTIAVHDDYDAGGWRVDADGYLEYRRDLAPGETRKTAFFARADEALAREFFVAPSIETVRPTTPGATTG